MTAKHQTGLLFVYYITFQLTGIFILKPKIYSFLRDILSICQLHILLSRTAQISLELHFCLELHTERSPAMQTNPVKSTQKTDFSIKMAPQGHSRSNILEPLES